MDFTPAETTVTGVCPSSLRSALASRVCSYPRCTPPIPPVTKILMPASSAPIIVEDTVVAPSDFYINTIGRSRRLTFFVLGPSNANLSIYWSVNPIFILPSMMAIVAGMAPCFLTWFSIEKAHYLFCGYGIPWDMIVDYKATTGRWFWRASLICGAIDKTLLHICFIFVK